MYNWSRELVQQKRAYLWLIVSTMIVSTFALLSVSAAPALSQEMIIQTLGQTDASLLQVTVTPTLTSPITNVSTFNVTFSDLGYGETTLNSPIGKAEYTFRLPSNWQLQNNGFIRFDLSYHYSPFDTSASMPATFGDVQITIDGQTAEVFAIEEPELDHYRVRVPFLLSPSNGTAQVQHEVVLTFNAAFLCAVPHRAVLVIHPTSFLSVDYTQSPLTLDLSAYPSPFYQAAFEPDQVIFGLPSQPSPAEATGAVALAAKLGSLTDNRMVISATLDLDLADLISSPSSAFDQHLIVIGQPQDNQLLPLLNQMVDLPVILRARQMNLVTEGPAMVSSGQTFTYTFTLTNTTNRSATLSLIDTLPMFAQFVNCDPLCIGDAGTDVISWTNKVLAPAGAENFSLTLKATDVITDSYFENTITLVEAGVGPINVDTLVSNISIDEAGDGEQQISAANKSNYFFAINGRAVAENDGVIQEIVSPWNENRAILIVTGLNDDAIRKASQAMSSSTRFPGMNGAVALVRDASPPEIDSAPPSVLEMTFQDLGYDDELIQGLLSQRINYSFFIPVGWRLTEDAFVDFRFTHSQAVESGSSGFTIYFNRTPVATLALSEETSLDGRVQATLPASAASPGAVNRLTIQVTPFEREGCTQEDRFKDFWFLAKSNSRIFLDHSQATETTLNLDYFPYPFNSHSSLDNLLFALPGTPTVGEWANTLRLAAALGNSAGGQTILPAVALGSNMPADSLADYHIIAVGRPSRNSLTRQVSPELPQPFLPNSDEIQQQVDDVIFRLPPGMDLGYLQLVPSSWNSDRAFLAITGTTDKGVSWAARAASERALLRRLEGNLSLIRDVSIESIDTRGLLKERAVAAIATAVPELTTTTKIANTPSVITPEPVASTDIPQSSQATETLKPPFWLVPLVVITVVIVLAIFGIAFVQARRRRSRV